MTKGELMHYILLGALIKCWCWHQTGLCMLSKAQKKTLIHAHLCVKMTDTACIHDMSIPAYIVGSVAASS